MTAAGGSRSGRRDRWWLVHLPLALVAFPIAEMAARGTAALQYAHDVFDEGSITRLGIVRQDWLAHGLTLWDPHLTAGNALWSQFAMPPIAFDTILSLLVGPFTAYGVTYLILVVLAGTGMYLFCRDSLGLPPVVALVGSIGYELVFWQYSLGFTAPLIPAALWLVDRPSASRLWGWRGVALLTALLVLALYDGQVQIAAFVGAAQVGWLVVTRPSAGPIRERALLLGVAWLAALLIYAPALLAEAVALPGSQRAFWDVGAGPISGALAQVVRSYAAVLLGLPGAGGWGALSLTYGTFFAGAVGLPLVVMGIVAAPRARPARAVQLALLAIPLLDLLAASGAGLGGHLGALGSFQIIRIRHLYPAVVWACAAVGGGALVSRGSMAPGRRRLALIAGSAVAALAGAWILRRSLVGPLATSTAPAAGEAATLGVVVGVLCVVVAGLLLLAAVSSRRTIAWLPVLLVLLLVCDRTAYARVQVLSTARLGPASPVASWDERVASNAAIEYLRAHVAPGDRVLTMASQPTLSEPNRLALAGLDLADGYQNVYPHTYQLVFGQMIAPNLARSAALSRYFYGWGNRAYALGSGLTMPIADLLGVRWVYADGTTPTVPGLTRVFSSGSVAVWENRDALPRAFLVNRVQRFADEASLVTALGRATAGELATSAFVTDDPGLAVTAGMTETAASVSIQTDLPDEVALEVRSGGAGLLVLRNTMATGWTATVNGRERSIAAVDGALRGVVVEAGRSQVVFRYRPWFVQVGALLAIAGIMLVLAAGVILRRRQPEESHDYH